MPIALLFAAAGFLINISVATKLLPNKLFAIFTGSVTKYNGVKVGIRRKTVLAMSLLVCFAVGLTVAVMAYAAIPAALTTIAGLVGLGGLLSAFPGGAAIVLTVIAAVIAVSMLVTLTLVAHNGVEWVGYAVWQCG